MLDPQIKNYIDQQLQEAKRLLNADVDRRLHEQIHDGNYSQRINFFDVFGQIETVTTAPTEAPTGGSPYDQLKIYYDAGGGPDWYLYVWDYQNSVWKSVALT